VTPVLAQMSCDSIRARRFTRHGGFDRIRLESAPSLPQSRNVIDIDVEALLLCSHCHSP
jgi:hypothetical protein